MDWLKEIRDNKRMSQQTIADAAGVYQGYYSMIERGERRPSVETAKKIAEALDFDWTRFFEDERGT